MRLLSSQTANDTIDPRDYAAIDDRDDDLGWPVGEGKTPAEAVADFAEQMQERGVLDK